MPKSIHTERHLRLRALLVAKRKEKGLSQAELAGRLGKPPSFVAKYELGERRLDLLEIIDIAAAVGFDACDLVHALEQ